jgi:SAM-dependent methyltransferase
LNLRPSTRSSWRRRWSDPGYTAPWSADGVPPVLHEAIASGWLRPGDAVLDIGCGDGRISELLARAGCEVTSIDFAEGAIARVEARCRHVADRVRAELCDITSSRPSRSAFAAFVDVGCLHAMPPADASRYGRNVAAVMAPAARGLIVGPIDDGPGTPRSDARVERLLAQISRAFGTAFRTVEIREAPASSPVGGAAGRRASLSVRLERTSNHVTVR